MSIKLLIRPRAAISEREPLEQTFDGPIITIGSDSAASLCLNEAGVAAEQAIIIRKENQWLLINRADGTALNAERLAREAYRPLTDGDTLEVGQQFIKVIFTDLSAASAPRNQAASAEETRAAYKQNDSQADSRASTNFEGPPRSYGQLMETMRTVEDSFHFMIQGGEQAGRCVPIETTVTLLGWDEAGRSICFETATIATACAIVRKDWSGVVVQPLGSDALAINNEPVASEQRLQDGDRLRLLPQGSTDSGEAGLQDVPFLIFHVPATLAVLDTLYQHKEESPSTVPETPSSEQSVVGPTPFSEQTVVTQAVPMVLGRKYFGYFTLLEVLVMCVGTLVAAVVFFLALVYFKPVR